MAPKRKSPSSSTKRSASSPTKRQRQKGGHQIAQNLHMVKAALRNREYELDNIPHEVREMLFVSAEHALKGESDERHEFQNANSKMIQDVFVGVRGKLEAARDETKNFVHTASEKEGELQAAVEAAKQALEAKKEEIKERTVAKAEDNNSVKDTGIGVEKAKSVEKELAVKKGSLMKEHTKANAVYDECFKVLRDGPATNKKEAQGLVKRISPMLHQMNAGDSMIRGLPAAILKSLEERGEFDKMTINAVDELFRKNTAEREGNLNEHAREQEAAQAATAAAQQATDAAAQKLGASTEALDKAENERSDCEAKLKAAQTALKDHTKRAKQASVELKGCESKIADFVKVEDAFAFMKNFSSKKPAEEEEAAAPQPEGTAPMQE